MTVNNEFASEVERLYKAEEATQHQHETLTTHIKELQHKLSRQSQATGANSEEKSNLELQIQELKTNVENVRSENIKLQSERQKVENNCKSRQEVRL